MRVKIQKRKRKMNLSNHGIFGFDVSWYQDINSTPQKIDFKKMKDYGASFVIIKVGQFIYADEDFRDNWKNAKEAGLPRGAYFFGDKDASGKSQAQKFWNLIKDDLPEGPVFVDFENGSWTDWNELYNFLVEFQTLSKFPNEKIGIYTGYYWWREHVPALKAQWFGKFLLWEAWYTDIPEEVLIPFPWTELLLWQSGTPAIGSEVGVESKEVDYDVFNGDEDKFKSFFGQNPNTPPEEPMVILYYADLKAGLTSNVRSTPGLNNTPIGQLTGPVTISIVSEKTTMDGYDWYQISYPSNGWIALTTSYTNLRPAGTASATAKAVVTFPDGTVWSGTLTKQ